MSKREADLKTRLSKKLAEQLPGFYVLHYSTRGAPDREIVGMGVSSRWEFKHGTPEFKSLGDQELLCMRLAAVAHCRYVIWQERRGVRQTLIVHPRMVHMRKGWTLGAEASCEGFDLDWLVDQIRKVHVL